jgi:ABC-type dipeptide/oligopeptide/nickel transport system permease component
VIRFLLGRVVGMVPILVGVTFLVFLLLLIVPGDPAVVYAGVDASAEEVEIARVALGLDRPIFVRYASFLGDALRGDLGTSLWTRQPVLDEIGKRLPYTIALAFAALCVAALIGIPLGVLSAVSRGGPFDLAVGTVAAMGVATPNFWIGLLLMMLFSLHLGWLPTSGASGWTSLILPAVSLGLAPAAILAKQTRSALLEVLGEDYVRTARAKGSTAARVTIRHGLRNALIPVVTLMGLQMGTLLGGSVVIEMVFAWPGMGRLLIQSINHRDFPMMQACILLLSLGFLLASLLVDSLYAALDPRIRY